LWERLPAAIDFTQGYRGLKPLPLWKQNINRRDGLNKPDTRW